MTSSFLGAGPLSDPTGARAAAVMVKYAAPDVVTDSHPDDVFGVIKVAANFADLGHQYPTHTAAAAWVSAATFHETGSDHSVVAERIKKACEFHRLWGEWERLEKQAADERSETAKKAAPSRWALPSIRKYPLDTPEQVKRAGDYFLKYADAFADADRKTFAAETAKAALELGWSGRPEDLRLIEAEDGLCRPPADPRRPFLMRAKAAANELNQGLADALVKAADEAGKDPAADAAVLRKVDKRAGWRGFGNPIKETAGETFSEVREKIASAARALSGNWYATSDLGAVPAAVLASMFGTGPVVAEPVLRSLLTDPVKSAAFETVLQNAGVKPLSAAPPTRVDWKAPANQS